jgi:hypothetical protein
MFETSDEATAAISMEPARAVPIEAPRSSVIRNWPAARVSRTSIAPPARADGAAWAVVTVSSADSRNGVSGAY